MCLGALGGVLGVNTYIAIFSVENKYKEYEGKEIAYIFYDKKINNEYNFVAGQKIGVQQQVLKLPSTFSYEGKAILQGEEGEEKTIHNIVVDVKITLDSKIIDIKGDPLPNWGFTHLKIGPWKNNFAFKNQELTDALQYELEESQDTEADLLSVIYESNDYQYEQSFWGKIEDGWVSLVNDIPSTNITIISYVNPNTIKDREIIDV